MGRNINVASAIGAEPDAVASLGRDIIGGDDRIAATSMSKMNSACPGVNVVDVNFQPCGVRVGVDIDAFISSGDIADIKGRRSGIRAGIHVHPNANTIRNDRSNVDINIASATGVAVYTVKAGNDLSHINIEVACAWAIIKVDASTIGFDIVCADSNIAGAIVAGQIDAKTASVDVVSVD